MICPRCQQTIRDGARFCDSCGFSIGSLAASDQAPSVLAETVKAADPLIGHVIDSKYQIIEQLGKGGMGVVYRAERVLVGDEVALKILRAEFVAEEETVERFRREARAAAKLRHPNVVTIYDYGEARGADAPAYIVMELLNGASLRDLLKREGRLQPERAATLMRGICAGIGLAHRRQIVHRDIKPDNIILLPPDEEEGREQEMVKVVDFGIAKLRDAATGGTLTRKGFQPGTIFYMSPEQCRGDDLDARSDVYSLGALLYEMLAGTPPFVAETQTGVIARHLFDPPPPFPKDLHVPPALERVVMHALAKESDARPADAGALGRELQEAGQQEREAGERRAEEERRHVSETLLDPTEPPPCRPDAVPQRKPETEPALTQSALTEPALRDRANFSATDPVLVSKPGLTSAVSVPSRGRNKLWIGLGAAVLVVGLVIAARLGLFSSRTDSASNPLETNRGTSSSSAIPPLMAIQFDTVTLDANGKVIDRRALQAQSYTEDLGGGVQLEMVLIPAGTFTMGSPANEKERVNNEGPQHQVTVPKFYMGKFEVTEAQWRAVANLPKVDRDLNPEPASFKGNELPVEQVSWEEAREFCKRLSKKTGREYRLPSEAQWEYAARAGTQTPFAFGETITPEIVNYLGENPYAGAPKGIYRAKTVAVGSLGVANAFGLYDMHGNVWEWCEDVYHSSYEGAPINGTAWESEGSSGLRVLRGGSWGSLASLLRSAYRYWSTPDDHYGGSGFRVAALARS